MFKPFLCAVLLIPSTFLCAHFYCIPALSHAEKYPMLAHYACTSMHISIALPLFPAYYPLLFLFISSSTFLFVRSAFYCISITFPLYFHCISYALHFHCISFPALLACINIIPCFILALTFFLALFFLVAFTHVCMC